MAEGVLASSMKKDKSYFEERTMNKQEITVRIEEERIAVKNHEDRIVELNKELEATKIPISLFSGQVFSIKDCGRAYEGMAQFNGVCWSFVDVNQGGWYSFLKGTFSATQLRQKLVDLNAKYVGDYCNCNWTPSV